MLCFRCRWWSFEKWWSFTWWWWKKVTCSDSDARRPNNDDIKSSNKDVGAEVLKNDHTCVVKERSKETLHDEAEESPSGSDEGISELT